MNPLSSDAATIRSEIPAWLGIEDLILKERRLRWCGHVEHSNDAVKTACDIQVDGWMTCDFTSFLTVFQSYQDDVRMIMKGCVQWNSIYG